MTKNEIANIDKMSVGEIMKAIGQDSGSDVGPSIPRLGINREPENETGNRLPIGSYFLFDTNIGENIYGKPVTFRPFIGAIQYMHFDPDKGEYVNRSVITMNWKDEAIDLQGGTRCGKVPRKEIVDLSPEDQAKQRQIKCYRLIYGTASFKGKRGNGDSHDVKDFPVLWRVTGTGFRPASSAIDETKRRKKLMFTCEFNLDSFRQKKGSNVFYVPIVKVNSDVNLPVTDKDKDTLRLFQEVIQQENDEIISLWKTVKNKRSNPTDGDNAKIIEQVEAEPAEILSS